jgi:S-adenosylmethionine-diacylglycerol 3-amino-3-carboxypropyl transferase
LNRAQYALTQLPTHNNPYLEYILTGNFNQNLPRYLRPELFSAVREGVHRLRLFHGPIQAAIQAHSQRKFDGYNLSDIFEYLDNTSTEQIYSHLLSSARSGARLVYWNMLAQRECPFVYQAKIKPLTHLAQQLFQQDKAFFYSSLVIEAVC